MVRIIFTVSWSLEFRGSGVLALAFGMFRSPDSRFWRAVQGAPPPKKKSIRTSIRIVSSSILSASAPGAALPASSEARSRDNHRSRVGSNSVEPSSYVYCHVKLYKEIPSSLSSSAS